MQYEVRKNEKGEPQQQAPLALTQAEQIETPAPISYDNLKRKFKEDVEFVVDYDASRFKGKTLITYLSNLDIKVRVRLTSPETALPLVADYLRMPALAKIPDLEDVVINILLAAKGDDHLLSFDPTAFIEENREIIDIWLTRINNLALYAIYIRGEEQMEYVESLPKDENISIIGINYVNMIRHPQFPMLIAGFDPSKFSYNEVFFNKYLFNAKNLFWYFAVPENPLFIASIMGDEHMDDFNQTFEAEWRGLDQLHQEVLSVPSIR